MKKTIFILITLLATVAVSAPVRSMMAARPSINTPATKTEYTARDYIQDGLVAMFDGIENAGWGVHDDSATIWINLVSNNHLTVRSAGGSWINNAFVCNGTTAGCYGNFSFNLENMTKECCISGLPTTSRVLNLISTPSSSQSNGACAGVQVNGNIVAMTSRFWIIATEKMSISCKGNNLKSYSQEWPTIYVNGNILSSQGEITMNNSGQWITFGARQNDAVGRFYYPCAGTIHNVRIYERRLSQNEILHNYHIDKARFNLP